MRFRQIRLPFIDTIDKAHQAARKINEAAAADGQRPIIFSTLVKPELSDVIRKCPGMHMDLFQTFVAPLEQELGVKSTHTIGRIAQRRRLRGVQATASRPSTSRWRMTTASRTRTCRKPT
jgi:regulator of PEP synthase PpsR (kinase-PPPase family)